MSRVWSDEKYEGTSSLDENGSLSGGYSSMLYGLVNEFQRLSKFSASTLWDVLRMGKRRRSRDEREGGVSSEAEVVDGSQIVQDHHEHTS